MGSYRQLPRHHCDTLEVKAIMANHTVLWGKLLSDYGLWRTADLPTSVTPVLENLEFDEELVHKLTQLAGSQFEESMQPFGEIFPMLFRLSEYGQIVMPTPVKNALGRNAVSDLPSMLTLTPRGFRKFRGVGQGIYLDLIEACIKASLWSVHSPLMRAPNASIVSVGEHETSEGIEVGEVEYEPWDPMLDYESIFTQRWYDVAISDIQDIFRSALTAHYLGIDQAVELAFVGQSNVVADAIRSRTPHTPHQLLEGVELPKLGKVVQLFIDELDANESYLLDNRLVSETPQTLDEVGVALGFTRERARQVESKTLAKYRETKRVNPYLGAATEALTRMVAHPVKLDALLKSHRQLGNSVGRNKRTVFTVLAALEHFEVVDGWVYRDHKSQLADFAAAIGSHLDVGAAPLADELADQVVGLWPGLNRKEAKLWLESCGWEQYKGHFVNAKRMSQESWAALILELEGKPLKDEVIHDRLPLDCSFRSFVNRLQGSPQFARTGASTYALTKWGLTPFTNIHDMLIAIVQGEGSVSLSAMVLKFTTEYGVAANSVRHYAKVHPLKVENGLIKRDDVLPVLTRPTRKNAFKNVYITPNGLAWRFTVTAEHIRGSGSTIPAALGYLAGVQINAPKVFRSEFGSIRLSVSGTANNIGSIKKVCTMSGVEVGDQLLATFADGQAEFRKVDLSKTGQSLVIELAALPLTGQLLSNLIKALELPANSSVSDVKFEIELRRDTELLTALNHIAP